MITGMARKKDQHLAPRITLRLPTKETDLLRRLAERNDRTVTAELLRALRKHLQAEGILPRPAE